MKDSAKLFFAAVTLSLIALFSNFAFGREVIPLLKDNMKIWVGRESLGARDWLSEEETDIMESLMRTQKKAESGEAYDEFVLTFGVTENNVQAMNMSLYRLTNGTNEFMLKYPNGNCYHVGTRQVLQLLTSETLDELLDYIEDAPTMTVTQGEKSLTVHCVENGWQYKKIDNSIFMDGVIVKDETRLLSVDDYTDLSLSFSTEPQSVRVKIEYPPTGETVFEDTAENLEKFDPPYTGTYLLTATARWNESGLRTYSGVCVYTAEIALIKETVSTISTDALAVGQLIAVTVTNPEVPETLQVITELGEASGFTKISEGTYRCIIAAKTEGIHSLTVRSAGYRKNYTVEVSARPARPASGRYYPFLKSGEELQSYEALRSYFGRTVSAEEYWSDPFIAPVQRAADIEAESGFADAPTALTGAEWWVISEQTRVEAVNTGVVVFVGTTDQSGLTVVVDHGLGVYSWYYGLTEVTVAQGGAVICGDRIGLVRPSEDPLPDEESQTLFGLQFTLRSSVIDPQQMIGQSWLD